MINTEKWMGQVDGDWKINEFTIPGTHESCSYYGDISKCQEIRLPAQLISGVRWLDIRCKIEKGDFALYHGPQDEHGRFDDDVLKPCADFLDSNPSECIIMSIKHDGENADNINEFEGRFLEYAYSTPNIWWRGTDGIFPDAIPKLNDVRGKIVLFRRFELASEDTTMGIAVEDWLNSCLFESAAKDQKFIIQDHYDTSADDKRAYTIYTLRQSMQKAGVDGIQYINFSSGSSVPGHAETPEYIASKVNPELQAFFSGQSTSVPGAIELDKNCGNFVVNEDHVYFQGGPNRTALYRVNINGLHLPGQALAEKLDDNCGDHFAVSDGYVYFQGGARRTGLYRVKCDGSDPAHQLDKNCGELVVNSGYVYFQGGPNRTGLYRVKADGAENAQELDKNCGGLVVNGEYVYFRGGPQRTGLYRVPCDGSQKADQLDKNCGENFTVNGDYVYFQGGPGRTGLYRVACNGSESAQQLDKNCGELVVSQGYVFFQGGDERTGLYQIKIDGSLPAKQLDKNCGGLVASGEYVYFRGGPARTGLYMIKSTGGVAQELNKNCGHLAFSEGFVYFQGGPERTGLYKSYTVFDGADWGKNYGTIPMDFVDQGLLLCVLNSFYK